MNDAIVTPSPKKSKRFTLTCKICGKRRIFTGTAKEIIAKIDKADWYQLSIDESLCPEHVSANDSAGEPE